VAAQYQVERQHDRAGEPDGTHAQISTGAANSRPTGVAAVASG